MEPLLGFVSWPWPLRFFSNASCLCKAVIVLAVLPFGLRRLKVMRYGPFSDPVIFVWLFLLKLSCADFHTCTIIHSFPSLIPSLFPLLAHTHTCLHTHTEENLYVSDIQQGTDKGTELITQHLLLLRRADGSRRYVNGKGQGIIRFF